MAPAARRLTRGPALLVPVPLAPARLRERGYNQAGLLATELALELGWSCRPLLRRRRQGRRQVRSGREDRALNVEDVFRIDPAVREEIGAAGELSELSIVLVDDVITTGATAWACARELDAAGLRCTGAVSFARTPPRVPGL